MRRGSRRKQSKNQTLFENAVLPVYESKEKERRPIYEKEVSDFVYNDGEVYNNDEKCLKEKHQRKRPFYHKEV